MAKCSPIGLYLQTPGYEYFNNRIGTPPFGDHALGNGSEFAIYGMYLRIIEAQDKSAADKMYATWCLAGKPLKAFWGENLILENFMVSADDYITEPGFDLRLEAVTELKNGGIHVFRNNYGQEKQSYFAIMSSPKLIMHGHYDQGSFLIYKNNIPIVMDSQIEGYFDSSTEWHLCSYSHACMLFAFEGVLQRREEKAINLSAGTYSMERGWLDVPRSSQVIDISIGQNIDQIKLRISHPEGKGYHIREVYWIKKMDIYIIRDTVVDYKGKLLFTLPVASQCTTIYEDYIISEGYYDIDLETVFLSPVTKIYVETGRTAPFLPSKAKVQMLEYIRAEADAETGFLVLLYPKVTEQEKLTIAKLSNSEFLINDGNGQELIIKETAENNISVQSQGR